MKVRLFIVFTFGVVLGCIGAISYIRISEPAPAIAFIGKVQLDTASYKDIRLNNAMFIENPGAPDGRVYLRFTDDKIMNDTVGKQVQVSGQLKSVKLEKGHFITELTVINVDRVDENLPATRQP
ncbi:hypothetical protein [Calothrix sp. PCC 6303]|uniref:hypothetical protein n=1 Tax=Calothrix sp. PCC 6303 TaxID=1170562 RepID=UPI0002A04F78|nr:hypothetical protein [Calothrix sp. PCC 6303]AFZ01608.1 hypothetical protein Cal6303_2635 [Calothrix sp. PCC 6303]